MPSSFWILGDAGVSPWRGFSDSKRMSHLQSSIGLRDGNKRLLVRQTEKQRALSTLSAGLGGWERPPL